MKKLFLFLLFSAELISCKKSANDEYYTVNGIVLDYDSKTPIAGAKVYPGYLCVGICLPTDSAISDGAGRVSFRFKKDISILSH